MAGTITINDKIQRLCRLCFSDGEIDLYSKGDEPQDILKKIYECFQVTLPYSNYMPSLICGTCVRELNITYSFKLKCLTVDDRFKEYCDDVEKSQTFHRDMPTEYALGEESDTDDRSNANENTLKSVTNKTIYIFGVEPDSNVKSKVCNKTLKTKNSLVKHCSTMHDNKKNIDKVSGNGTSRRYHCTACSYSTPHSQTLVNHMRRHNGDRPYSCECGKKFTQSSSLAAHRKIHSTVTYFTCNLCGKQFKHAFALKNHLRVHETGNYSCSVCFKLLKSKQTLQSHMDRHYNVCNYNCEQCGDTFVTSSELLNHRRKHSVEKNIECHLCGYKTHTKKNLIIHLKRHTGNRSFKCNTCQVAFYTQSNLVRHQRVHTKDKPFSCPTCKQKFSYSPSLNKHMKTVHGVDYKWADFKWKGAKTVHFSIKSEHIMSTSNKT